MEKYENLNVLNGNFSDSNDIVDKNKIYSVKHFKLAPHFQKQDFNRALDAVVEGNNTKRETEKQLSVLFVPKSTIDKVIGSSLRRHMCACEKHAGHRRSCTRINSQWCHEWWSFNCHINDSNTHTN